MKIVLLLTATITPQYSLKHLTRTNPIIRLNDYIEALNLWITKGPFNHIIFCENSGYDLNLFKNKVVPNDKNIEFLSYIDTPIDKFGYGYSELGLIDYVFDNSELIKNSDFFVKCTGRLFFPKTNKLLPYIHKNDLFHVDARNDFLIWKNQHITTQLMVFSKYFYQEFFYQKRNELAGKECIENFFYRKLIDFQNQNNCSFRWPYNIDPIGIRAHSNSSYQGLKWKFVYFIRGICRRLFPNLWI